MTHSGQATPTSAPRATVIEFDELPSAGDAERFEGANHHAQVSFFINHNPPGTGTRLHSHPYEETFIILAGTVRFTVADQTIDALANEVVVVPAYAPHKFLNTGDAPLQKVSIHPAARMQTEWLQDPDDDQPAADQPPSEHA